MFYKLKIPVIQRRKCKKQLKIHGLFLQFTSTSCEAGLMPIQVRNVCCRWLVIPYDVAVGGKQNVYPKFQFVLKNLLRRRYLTSLGVFTRGLTMVVERDLIVSLLKLTKNGPASIGYVRKDAKVASDLAEKSLDKLQNEDLLHMKGDVVEVDGHRRLKLAVKAVSLGADVEYVSGFLRWQEFEDIAAVALESNGYVVSKNVRFKQAGRRWEIDVVGCKKPLVICLDCKHWHHRLSPSALAKIAEAQVERTRALAESLPNLAVELGCAKWSRAKFVPAILALLPSSLKFHEAVPIVPVLQLQDFVSQLPAYADSLTHFTKEFSHLRHDFQD